MRLGIFFVFIGLFGLCFGQDPGTGQGTPNPRWTGQGQGPDQGPPPVAAGPVPAPVPGPRGQVNLPYAYSVPQQSGCTFDPNCFFYAQGCTLIKCPPFNRTTPVSCNQCLQMCQEKQVAPPPYSCRSIVYDCQTQTCDMFAADETNGGYLSKNPNKFYFKPTGQCLNTPAPNIPGCPAGQAAKMIAVKDSQFSGISGQPAPGLDELGCGQACLKNQLPGGTPIDCHSAQFKGGQCTLATSTATSESQIQPDPGSSYFQKFCFDAASVAGCPDVFDEYPQKVLIGQSRQVVDSQSLQDCVQQCLNAKTQFGFGCNSADFYYNVKTQNCILNDETRATRPDLFTDIKDDKVTYIQTLCGGPPGTVGPAPPTPPGPFATSGPLITSATQAPLFSPVQTTLGPFTPVTLPGGLTTVAGSFSTLGFLNPSFLADKRKEAFDKPFRDFSSDSVCRALVYNGLKKCPIGVVTQAGRPRYCVHPVDC